MRQLAKLLSRFPGSEGSNPSLSATPRPKDLQGQSVLILGLGAFGGGSGCTRALCELGARVQVTDLRSAEDLQEARAELQDLPLEWALGGHPDALFHGQWVVVNPAVPPHAEVLQRALATGCRLTTDLDLALAARPDAPAFAVTGTHGKSTAVSLATHLLQLAGIPVAATGNFGGSSLAAALALPSAGRLVVEVSSFQAERLQPPPNWPAAALLTSLGEDHLDWHGDIDAYHRAKRSLPRRQSAEGWTLTPAAGPGQDFWQGVGPGRTLSLGQPGQPGWWLGEGGLMEQQDGQALFLAELADLPFADPWRQSSLLGAVGGARKLGLPAEAVATGLRSWPGLPHRMEALPAPAGMHILNNGVATHPEATMAALVPDPRQLILCAGGQDKGLDLAPLAGLARNCAAVHLSGPGGARLAQEIQAQNGAAHWHDSAKLAMQAALNDLAPNRTLLFSPSFSSFDEFRNFRDRAEMFRKLCQNYSKSWPKPEGDGPSLAY